MCRDIVAHVNLFDNDLPLFFNVRRVESGVEEHIGQYLEGDGEMGSGHLAPVDGQLFVRTTVKDTAHAFNGRGNFAGGRTFGGAPEAEVFNKMGDAGLGLGFMTRTGVDKDAHGYGAGVRHRGGYQAKSVIECRFTKQRRIPLAILGMVRFWLVMSSRAEGKAIYINNVITGDCFVTALPAMTNGFNQMQIEPSHCVC